MNTGVLYGVGVGPGDSELLTIKAVKILKSVDIIAVPKSRNESRSTALDIANEYIKDKEIVEILFPMSFDKNILNNKWLEARDTIVDLLSQNKNIAFVTLGDPTIYSTFMYLNTLVNEAGYKTVIISGITSFCACAAEAGISLSENNQSIAIIPTAENCNDLEKKLDSFDTIVIMKFRKNFEYIKNLLIAKDLIKNSIIVEKCTMKDQKIHRDIKNLDKDRLEYFSTMIINKRVI